MWPFRNPARLLRGEAFAEGDQQPWRPLDADPPAENRPQEAPLLRHEPQPRLAVRRHEQVCFALVAVPNLQGAVPEGDGRLPYFFAGEGEVVDGVQLRRLPRLERERKTRKELLDRAGPHAVADPFDRLVGKTAGHMLFGVRAGDDIDRLLFLLQRTYDLPQMPGLVGEVRADDIFPCWADAQAVRRLVVGPEGKALPHRRRFRVRNLLAVVQGVLAVGDPLDPIGEPAHELPVVVRVAGREVEVTVRGDGPHRTRRHAQLALQARVVRERLVVGSRLGTDQYRAQQDEVAEAGVDDVAVYPHVPQAGGYSDRLVRHDPDLLREAVHLHREAHRR